MKARISVLWDGLEEISFVQGEDRGWVVALHDADTDKPIDLTTSDVTFSFAQYSGDALRRSTVPLTISSANVSTGVAGAITYPLHGLVTGDPVTVAPIGGGTLPTPLAGATQYTVLVLDADTFALGDTDGDPVMLSSSGTGLFSLANDNDVVISNPVLGEVTLTLRAPVTRVIVPGIGQATQVTLTDASGKSRIVVGPYALDVVALPYP